MIKAIFTLLHRVCDPKKTNALKYSIQVVPSFDDAAYILLYTCYIGSLNTSFRVRKVMIIHDIICDVIFSFETQQTLPIFFFDEHEET